MKISFYYLIGGVLFIVKRPILGCAQKPRNSKPTDSVGVDFPPLENSVKVAHFWPFLGIFGDSEKLAKKFII
jgi:hypothetical protein